MKNFLSVNNVNDLNSLIELALEYKKNPLQDKHLGLGKVFGMIFMNPSLRTRVSSQIAAENLGMQTNVLNIDKDSWQLEFKENTIMNQNKSEHVKEAAAVLGQYWDILGIRSFAQLQNKEEDKQDFILNQFVKYSNKPAISLEGANLHPLQSLADLVSIQENWKLQRKPKIVMTWAPHVKPLPQAVPNSFAQWINAWGKSNFIVTHPPQYELDQNITGKLNIEYDQEKALKDADFIYVKNWSASEPYGQIVCTDLSWTFTMDKHQIAPNSKIMHCLPVRRNLVISDEVLDSEFSIVIQQAKNRICSAQAVLATILKNLAQ